MWNDLWVVGFKIFKWVESFAYFWFLELGKLVLVGYLSADDSSGFVEDLECFFGGLTLGCDFWRLRKTIDKGLVLKQFIIEGILHFLLRFSDKKISNIFGNNFLRITKSILLKSWQRFYNTNQLSISIPSQTSSKLLSLISPYSL